MTAWLRTLNMYRWQMTMSRFCVGLDRSSRRHVARLTTTSSKTRAPTCDGIWLGRQRCTTTAHKAAPGGSCALLCTALHCMGMARACVSEDRTIGPISWWRTPTKHANLSAADQPLSAKHPIAVTAHTQRSQPLPPCHRSKPPLRASGQPSPPLATLAGEHTRFAHWTGTVCSKP